VVFFYTPLKCQDLKKSVNIEIPEAQIAKTGSIPGLYVFDNIITDEEEKQMLSEIDKGKWTKLLNRRVQHFGYEFKYGTNNVDPSSKIGDLPSFCDPLLEPMSKVLKSFKKGEDDFSAIKLN
jgi:alkylated DNA repair protein alkB family protein 8